MRRGNRKKATWPGPLHEGSLETVIIRRSGNGFAREFAMSDGKRGRWTQDLPMVHLAGVVRCLCAGNYRNKPREIRFEGFK